MVATSHAVDEAPGEDRASKSRQRPGGYSGRLLLRMPRGLHEELAQASDRNGVSLNQFITGVLAGAVGWRREDGARAGEELPVPRTTSRRLSVLLALNLVVVGAAAIAAIAFLVAAWLT